MSKVCVCPYRCGQLGHLTKQCKNEFSRFYGGTAGPGGGFGPEGAVSAVTAAGVLPLAGPAGALPPVAEGAAMPDLSSSDLSSGSSSESDSESEKRKRKARDVVVSLRTPLCVRLCSLRRRHLRRVLMRISGHGRTWSVCSSKERTWQEKKRRKLKKEDRKRKREKKEKHHKKKSHKSKRRRRESSDSSSDSD